MVALKIVIAGMLCGAALAASPGIASAEQDSENGVSASPGDVRDSSQYDSWAGPQVVGHAWNGNGDPGSSWSAQGQVREADHRAWKIYSVKAEPPRHELDAIGGLRGACKKQAMMTERCRG